MKQKLCDFFLNLALLVAPNDKKYLLERCLKAYYVCNIIKLREVLSEELGEDYEEDMFP